MEAYNSFNSEACSYNCIECGEEGHDSITLAEDVVAEIRCKKCNALLFVYFPNEELEKEYISKNSELPLYRLPSGYRIN